jgi:hypothetical protein
MRTKRFGKVLTVGLFAVVLGALSYSAAVLLPNDVYAASCTCSEEKVDAGVYCYENFHDANLDVFICPRSGNEYSFECRFDPSHHLYTFPCD